MTATAWYVQGTRHWQPPDLPYVVVTEGGRAEQALLRQELDAVFGAGRTCVWGPETARYAVDSAAGGYWKEVPDPRHVTVWIEREGQL